MAAVGVGSGFPRRGCQTERGWGRNPSSRRAFHPPPDARGRCSRRRGEAYARTRAEDRTGHRRGGCLGRRTTPRRAAAEGRVAVGTAADLAFASAVASWTKDVDAVLSRLDACEEVGRAKGRSSRSRVADSASTRRATRTHGSRVKSQQNRSSRVGVFDDSVAARRLGRRRRSSLAGVSPAVATHCPSRSSRTCRFACPSCDARPRVTPRARGVGGRTRLCFRPPSPSGLVVRPEATSAFRARDEALRPRRGVPRRL